MKEEIIEKLFIVKNIPIADRESLMKINQTNKFRKLFIIGNEALKQICESLSPDLTELNQLIYCTSKILQHKCGIKSRIRKISQQKNHQNLEMKIENEIGKLRKEISILDELQNGKLLKPKRIIKKYHLKEKHQISTIKEELKQKLRCKAQSRFIKRIIFIDRTKYLKLMQKSSIAKLEKILYV